MNMLIRIRILPEGLVSGISIPCLESILTLVYTILIFVDVCLLAAAVLWIGSF